jgi:hypothetical protein
MRLDEILQHFFALIKIYALLTFTQDKSYLGCVQWVHE